MLRCSNGLYRPSVCRPFPLYNFAIRTRSFSSTGRRLAASNQPSPDLYPEASSSQHSNLATFLEYAKRVGLDPKSTVYIGTHYEYTVAESLARHGFSLKRIGGASDFGTDLLGTWTPPTTSQTLKTLIQCKGGVQKTGPQFIRELEGAFVGAPPGWRGGPGVVAFLASEREATKGVRDALGRSRLPMGYLCCSEDGLLKQMLWNQRAEQEGLQGFGVTLKRRVGKVVEELVLLKNGKPLPMI